MSTVMLLWVYNTLACKESSMKFFAVIYEDLESTSLKLLIGYLAVILIVSRIASWVLFQSNSDLLSAVNQIFSQWGQIKYLFALLTMAALLEEFIFRFCGYLLVKVLHKHFETDYPTTFIIVGLISSTIFGLLQTQYHPIMAPLILVFGFVYFVLYEKAARKYNQLVALAITSIFHFAFNYSLYLVYLMAI